MPPVSSASERIDPATNRATVGSPPTADITAATAPALPLPCGRRVSDADIGALGAISPPVWMTFNVTRAWFAEAAMLMSASTRGRYMPCSAM